MIRSNPFAAVVGTSLRKDKRFAILTFMVLMISWPSMAYSADWNFYHGNSGHYVGDIFNGKRTGHGTATYPCGCKYVGEWLNNKYHGHGVYVGVAHNKWDGNFVNGYFEGHGKITHLRNGNGSLAGETFEGTFLHGEKVEGVRTMPNGTRWHEKYGAKGNLIEHKQI